MGTKWSSREVYSGRKGGGGGGGGGGSLGKEKLAGRLRQREPLSMLMMTERDMVDTELLSYREDLENQDCLTQMDNLQVSVRATAQAPLTPVAVKLHPQPVIR